jgi:hypothetical protein
MVVDRMDPDQIILFGSGARAELREDSDLDLLVVSRAGNRQRYPARQRWSCERTGDDLDIVVASRQTAERRRRSAAYIHGKALEEGRTIYTRTGAELLPTGSARVRNGNTMVETSLYEPDLAEKWVRRAARKLKRADFELDGDRAEQCQDLQEAMERALKALIVAQGDRVRHEHNLRKLWQQAESGGEKIRANPDPSELDRLSLYAGLYQYPLDGSDPALEANYDPERTWTTLRKAGGDLIAHAEELVPVLVKQTRDRLDRQRRAEPVPPPSPGAHRQ